MPISFIPFTAFVPDGGDYGPNLAKSENMLPVFGSWRPLNQAQAVSSVTGGPVTGAFVHIYQQARSIQFLRPDADTTPGAWLASTGSSLFDAINEVDANDGDFVFVSNAPSASAAKIGLSNPPATPGGTNNIIRWRYRVPATGGSWTAKIELMEGTDVIATDTATGTAVTGWVQRSYSLSAPEIADIGVYNNLFFRLTGTSTGAAQFARPTSDISVGSWETQADGSVDLYLTIDESSANDADYAHSPSLAAGGQAYAYTAALSAIADPLIRTGFTWRYRYQATNSGVTVTARLKCGTTTVKEVTHTNAATTWTTNAVSLSSGELALITDWAALRTEIEGSWPSDAAGTVYQYARPSSDVSIASGFWFPTPTVAIGSYYTAVDEASVDTADYVSHSGTHGVSDDPEGPYSFGISAVADPLSAYDHQIGVYAFIENGQQFQVELRTPSAQIAVMQMTGTGGYQLYTYNLTAAEANSISDYSILQLRLNQADGVDVFVAQLYLRVPQVRQAQLSWAELEGPSNSRVEVSWAEFEVPDASTAYHGDIPTIFAGVKAKLYEVGAAWTDISKGGGYAGGASYPTAWSFCSFGNHVVATNYVDPVQYRADNAGSFADLITSTDKPKARFCGPFKESLLLGGINFTGHYDDEVWWSAAGNIRDFDASITTQADFQRLTSCPGQVMGIVGGDFALVFKRRSLHALDWVGGSVIVNVRDVSASIGTPFPRSIVSANGYIYFWGGNSFYRTDGYAPPVAIGDDSVARYLMDAEFSGGALQPYSPTSIGEEDQLMVGWYDPAAGLVFWHYMGTGESSLAIDAIHGTFEAMVSNAKNAVSHHSRAIAYSPTENRWTTVFIPYTYGSGPAFAYCCQRGNVTGEETYLLKGTVGFDWDGTTSRYFRFSSGSTYRGTFTTKRQAIALDENERPMAVRVKGILPVFSTSTNDGAWPALTIRASMANDVQFIVNLTTQTYTKADANEAGWYPHDLAGTWLNIDVSVPSMASKMVTAFKGVYVVWELRGRSGGTP